MAFTNPIDIGTPLGSESISQGDNRIRETKSGIQELLNVDHEASLTGSEINSSDSGAHNKCTFIEQGSDPSAPSGVTTDFGIVYTKLDADTSQSELFWKDENDNILQVTKGNTINLDLNFLSNDTALEGNNLAADAVIDMIKVDTSDQVVIGHTITKPARLSTTDPPLADADISNKKYVDDVQKEIQAPQARSVNTTYDEGESGFAYVEYEFTWDFNVDQTVNILSSSNGGVATTVATMGCHCLRGDSELNQVRQSITVPIPKGYGWKFTATGANIVFKRASWYSLIP